MKLLKLLSLLVLLASCTHLPGGKPSSSESEAEPSDTSPSNHRVLAEMLAAQADGADKEESYLPVSDWLVQRQTTCQQDDEAIDAQLTRYRQSFSDSTPSGEDEQIVLAYSQLKALMLATCKPARTPGLLKNFLDAITEYEHWPPEYSALFDLLQDEYQAYALLEQQYRALRARHQKTIDGIGNIEQSLESQTTP